MSDVSGRTKKKKKIPFRKSCSNVPLLICPSSFGTSPTQPSPSRENVTKAGVGGRGGQCQRTKGKRNERKEKKGHPTSPSFAASHSLGVIVKVFGRET